MISQVHDVAFVIIYLQLTVPSVDGNGIPFNRITLNFLFLDVVLSCCCVVVRFVVILELS